MTPANTALRFVHLFGGGYLLRSAHSCNNKSDPYLLIVDDEMAILDVTRSMACALGWQPLLANTSEHALELFREHADDIGHVLIDLHMPRINGLELADAMRRIRPQVHVAIMTGDEPATASAMGGPGRVNSVLVKPFTLEDLDHGFKRRPRAA